jgi:ABC-type multidrug transport system fused ATPase/permease subunit
VFANVLDSLLLAKATGGSGGPGISVQLTPFPVAAGRVSTFEDAVSPVFGLYMVLAFMWPFSRLVRHIVDEKERRLKEGMMMMGLRNSVFWWSWALTYLLIFGLVAVLGAFILSINLFSYANLALVVLLYLLYAVSLICLGLLVSTFFDRAKTAGTLSNFLLIIIYIPFVAVSSPNRGEAGKLGACLLSPVAFSLANLQLLQYEKAFIGVQWDNVAEITNNFQFVWGLVFLAGDCALYLLLAWYFDRVLPKEYGTHLPWHFPFHASYWRGSDDWDASPSRRFAVVPHVGESQVLTDPLLESGERAEGGRDGEGDGDKVRYEPVPPELRDRVGVRIRSLRKAFGEMVAVSGLTLDLYRGQIFVLLGKNGAGKTTTVREREMRAARAFLFLFGEWGAPVGADFCRFSGQHAYRHGAHHQRRRGNRGP